METSSGTTRMGGLELSFLGAIKVVRDGRCLPLPPSRKTRALLAWLCLNNQPFRREQLCDLLWEVPDDPRGSLRWSLSKLRRLLDDDGIRRVVADRTWVEIRSDELAIDVTGLYAIANDGLAAAPTETLEAAAARFRGNFLEELEFSNFHRFHAWCVAEREQTARAQAAVLRELVSRLETTPERALPHARALVGIAPYDEPSRAQLIRLLYSAHYVEEANQQYELGMRMLKEAGIAPTGVLLAARRHLASGAPGRVTPKRPAGTRQETVTATDGDELIGRGDEAGQLDLALSAVMQSRRAAIVLVRGEPGIGKSRMLEYVVGQARGKGVFLLEASAFETGAIRPFALWIDALRAGDGGVAERIFGSSDAKNRDRLFSSLSDFIASEAVARPAVLVFDDVQWCDESSAAALHYVARMNRNGPVLGVIAARDAELQDNAPLQQALRGLRHDGLLKELHLGPLPDDQVAKLIASRSPAADCGRLSRECGGNPLLAIELARAENEGVGTGSLDQLIRERLARFDLNGAEAMRWAAVLNPRIEVETLSSLTGLPAGAVAAILEEAAGQALLTCTERGLVFSHELVARAIYTDISPVRRQLMHRRVAERMQQDPALEPAHASDLAHHATQSGDAGLAAKAMVSAARLCLRFFANEDALSLARRGLELSEQLPPAERVCVSIDLHGVMLVAAPLDNWEEAACRYAALAEAALDHGALAHARRGYHMASYVRWEHGHWTGAREQILQSERAARGGSDDEHLIGIADTAKCLVMLERDLPQADAMLMEADARAGRKRYRHHSIPAGLGMLRFYENRLDEAEELLKEARTLCKCDGDRVNEYQANEYLVMIDIQRGRYRDALSHCGELVALGGKLRSGSEAPFGDAMHGLCVYALEDDPAPLAAALDDLRIADAKHRLAYVLTRTALLDLERGRTLLAVRRAREALGYAEVLERRTEMMLAHAVLGLGHDTLGQADEAALHFAEAAELEKAGVAEWARGMAAGFTESAGQPA